MESARRGGNKMDKMKRFIDIQVPITHCNLKCDYCYITHMKKRDTKINPFMYPAEHIGKALSKKRLGGTCLFNMCGYGETLIPEEIIPIISAILEQGHYLWIVTNGLIVKRFEELMKLPQKFKNRLAFKFSFHYRELVRTGQMELFWSNVKLVQENGCSFSIEVTPTDELIPYIEKVKKEVESHVDALPHITIARNQESEKYIPILSKLSKKEYKNTWKTFNSDMFNFKMSVWGQKRNEYCYAGYWSGLLNIGNGDLKACYESRVHNYIFNDISKPIHFTAIGCHCKMPHCYNSHSFLALGNIPEIRTCTYDRIRNRICTDGTEWLNKQMKEFISQRLEDNNKQFGLGKKVINEFWYYYLSIKRYMKRKWEISTEKRKCKNKSIT